MGIYLVLLLVLLENIYVKGLGGGNFTDDDLERQLKILNKPYVKSFKIADNDIDTFDCVNIYQQPALSHPLLKGHKIQISIVSPKEAVPYYGVYAEINIQNPTAAERQQFSEALMTIECTKGDEANDIQVGWMVYEALYKDTHTRLVTQWAIVRGETTIGGCYNTLCPGFVQVHRSIAPGFPLPSSTYGGIQQENKFLIYKDRSDGNWWLVFGKKNEKIGYWPNTLFTTLRDSGDLVGWGGQVAGPVNEPSPPMGSGHFAEEGFRKAAYINNLQFLDAKLDRHSLQWGQLARTVTTSKCYTLAPFGSNGIFYGGPGGNCV